MSGPKAAAANNSTVRSAGSRVLYKRFIRNVVGFGATVAGFLAITCVSFGAEPSRTKEASRADVAREYLLTDRAFTGLLIRSGGVPDGKKLREINARFDWITNLFIQSKLSRTVEELRLLTKDIAAASRAPGQDCIFPNDDAESDPVARADAECPEADRERESLLKRLGAITPVSEAHRTVIEIVRARAALITPRPDFSNSESFLQPWNCDGLGARVGWTVDGLEKGQLFGYTSPQGYWPLIVPDAPPIAMRLPQIQMEHEPDPVRDAAIERSGRPVIVALHGVGGDETIFEFAYGRGLLTREAQRRDAILVLPRTEFFGMYPDALPMLLDQLELFHKIDRSRVYLIGHSMGAQAALGLARKHRDLVRAAVLFAGGVGIAPGAGSKPEDLPPILMIGGELDRVFRAETLRTEAALAAAGGFNVELRIKPDYGHVLVVNGALHEAMLWLESQALPLARDKGW